MSVLNLKQIFLIFFCITNVNLVHNVWLLTNYWFYRCTYSEKIIINFFKISPFSLKDTSRISYHEALMLRVQLLHLTLTYKSIQFLNDYLHLLTKILPDIWRGNRIRLIRSCHILRCRPGHWDRDVNRRVDKMVCEGARNFEFRIFDFMNFYRSLICLSISF